jgi:hypothetical protein
MLGIAQVSDDQVIVVKPAVKFSSERGVYLAPVTWTGQTMMFCLMRERLMQEFTQAVADSRDLAAVFDPETYRGLAGQGVYLDYYHYAPPEPGEKNQRNYANGVGVCYVTDAGDQYTRADFLRLCNGEETVARRLFDLCDWQAPETLLDEVVRDQGMQLPVLTTFDAQLTCLTFPPDELVPDEAKRALLSRAGWRESLSRSFTCQGQAAVPYGIAYVSAEAPRTVNLEPTANGYRAMKQLFQESVETYQEQLQHLDVLLLFIQAHQFGEATGGVHELTEEIVAEKRATIEDAVSSLTETIAQLERCGY